MDQRKIRVLKKEAQLKTGTEETNNFPCICNLSKESINKECIGVCDFE